MDQHDHLVEEWVSRRMAAAASPDDWPNAAAGWRRVRSKMGARSRRGWIWAGATAAACAAALAVPSARATARQLWDQVILGRVQVLLLDLEGGGAGFVMPDVYKRPEASPVSSIEEASRAGGFSPRLPRPGIFKAAPTFSVTDVGAARLTVRTAALRYLVARFGGSASQVPAAWNGATLEVRAGPIIVADYGGTLLLQSLPFELIKPADLDLERFYPVAFRALGMSESDARAFGADLSISPAMLMVMPKEERHLIDEFSTRSGAGIMIHEVYGAGKTVAVWSGADRVYALYPSTATITRGFVLEVADALD
jgi:hypothetical protein